MRDGASGPAHTRLSVSCVAQASVPFCGDPHQNSLLQGLNPEAQASVRNVERRARSPSRVVWVVCPHSEALLTGSCLPSLPSPVGGRHQVLPDC